MQIPLNQEKIQSYKQDLMGNIELIINTLNIAILIAEVFEVPLLVWMISE